MMVNVLTSNAIDRGFESRSGQTKDYKIDELSNLSAISWREQVNFQWDDDEVLFVLNQHVELDFYSASSLKQVGK
jgi:hypothetical protein